MLSLTFLVVLLISIVTLTSAQWSGIPNRYVTYSPSLYLRPTFSNLNTYTTPYPYIGYNTQNKIRIWPYVIGGYGGYPYNNNYNQNNNYPYNGVRPTLQTTYDYNNNNYDWYNSNNWYTRSTAATKK